MERFRSFGVHSTAASTRSSSFFPARRTKTAMNNPNRESSLHKGTHVADSSSPTPPENRGPTPSAPSTRELNDRLVSDLIDAVKGILRKEQSDRLRDVYLIGDIEKDTARNVIERLRELANDNDKPI